MLRPIIVPPTDSFQLGIITSAEISLRVAADHLDTRLKSFGDLDLADWEGQNGNVLLIGLWGGDRST